MPEPTAPNAVTDPLPPPSANGVAQPSPARQQRRRRPTRISNLRTAMIVGFVALIAVVIFIIQNAHAVRISFLGAHLQLSLAVALLLAAIAGALVMAAAGTARITQLRRVIRRNKSATEGQPPSTAGRRPETGTPQ
jgi:lipopolysaccharide assembly protein A